LLGFCAAWRFFIISNHSIDPGCGAFDNTPDVVRFAETLERVCIDTVEGGEMTRDLAILSPEHPWLTTNQFLDKLDVNLQQAMA